MEGKWKDGIARTPIATAHQQSDSDWAARAVTSSVPCPVSIELLTWEMKSGVMSLPLPGSNHGEKAMRQRREEHGCACEDNVPLI